MNAKLLVGIDGGAGKTTGLLCDADGAILAKSRHGPSALLGTAEASPDAWKTLRRITAELCESAGVPQSAIARWAFGLNGIDFADELPDQRRKLAQTLSIGEDEFSLVNDGIAALWGATPSPAAAIFQHGSGITSAWRARPGGDTLFDSLNVGDVFDIRGELVRLAARMIDGRQPATPLLDHFLDHVGVGAKEFSEAAFRRRIDPARLATTPPLVYQAWLSGDKAAAWLVEQAISDYAVTAATMGKLTRGDQPDLCFGGGVIRQAPAAFWQDLRAALARLMPGARVVQPRLAPEAGAALLAAFTVGVDTQSMFERMERQTGMREP
jgi:N-acetylglucosamine kinase-like BadF-type ATPase